MRRLLLFFFLSCIFTNQIQTDQTNLLDHFHVCTVASHKTENLEKLLLSCKLHHIDLKILGLGKPYIGHGTKLAMARDYVNTLDDDEIFMLVDAYDVLFVADKKAILEKFLSMNVSILMSAEKNCHPNKYKDHYPSHIGPFKYINAGAWIGYAKNIKSWLNDIGPIDYACCDQGLITGHYLDGNIFFEIDHQCNIFLSLFDVQDKEVAIDRNHKTVTCVPTASQPMVIHANGRSFRIWNKIYRQLIQK